MPYCPYGIEAAKNWLELEKSDQKAIKEFYLIAIDKQVVERQRRSIASSELTKDAGCESVLNIPSDPNALARGRFYSLHGASEVEEGIRQIVIGRKWPQVWRLYMMRFLSDPKEQWQERCKAVGLDPVNVEKTTTSKQAESWYAENISSAERNHISISPSLVINGNKLNKFPNSTENLRTVLCSTKVLSDNCQGILCTNQTPCPEKHGYIGECLRGTCQYQIAPTRTDAVQAYLIIPKNCLPAAVFPVEEAVKGWMSYFKIIQLDLEDTKAQELLKGVSIKSFPVLIVDSSIEQREWGDRCIQELSLLLKQNRYMVTMEWEDTPFLLYARIHTDAVGIHVLPNHYAGALVLHRMGKLEAATKAYRLALVENPKDYRAWNNLGAILYDQGFKQTGGAMFEEAVTLNGSYESGLANLAKYYAENNKSQEIDLGPLSGPKGVLGRLVN